MIEWVTVPVVLATSVAETVTLFAFHKKVMAVVIGGLAVTVGIVSVMWYLERKKRRS